MPPIKRVGNSSGGRVGKPVGVVCSGTKGPISDPKAPANGKPGSGHRY